MADPARLARVLRVRTLQLGLAQAEEMRARAAHEQESALSSRIARLAEEVSPVEDRAAGFSLAAAAHYRDRLHRSAETAANRVRTAEAEAARAAEATRAAKRDQSAVEKLIERGLAEAALREIRALRDAPPTRKIRHDPC
ncbi:hypothetical protein F9288_04485 [Sphingomonas sp. CL5.1]|uniref:hypothetical protein n=1 Tax=Sphingomonas sp. CL5.1 TaxID=2653203 RepID=UPI00158407AD|nr:hypothetical protein [Sphingomonas sp. CL5.1]QKR98983.1 hypothetical protein F9288_04485 [Sphingomonas sp. CL5.1]